jgi:hypothetical protein
MRPPQHTNRWKTAPNISAVVLRKNRRDKIAAVIPREQKAPPMQNPRAKISLSAFSTRLNATGIRRQQHGSAQNLSTFRGKILDSIAPQTQFSRIFLHPGRCRDDVVSLPNRRRSPHFL